MTKDIIPPFFFSFFESFPWQGPGDDQITRSILKKFPNLPGFLPVAYAHQKKLLTGLLSEPRTPEENDFLNGIEQESHFKKQCLDISGYVVHIVQKPV
ncbi:MAG: hypothetical protein LUQ50_07835 [Methanospirillum sp.]|uniref:hypothetical protein n=1 Tax=Methanospirillum sp. TaxID=45200 RepID=UPI0023759FFE|nr:hypothetical protein [Methanospirillum sp.]MDD1728966.1 hypothetical protein [Methanospirillum sp.]